MKLYHHPPITSHVCDRLISNHSSVYVKENFQESHFQKKTFRSVNLLESLCKIVEFIFKIIVHHVLSSPSSARGWQKAA